MAIDFGNLLAEKYGIERRAQESTSGLQAAQTAAVPITTASEAGLRGAQAFAATQAGLQAGPLTQIEEQKAQAQQEETSARAGYYGALGRATTNPLEPAPDQELQQLQKGLLGNNILGFAGGTSNVSPSTPYVGDGWSKGYGESWGALAPRPKTSGKEEQKYKSGATKVPGKGSGKVDTVPAMLAPGEAVLNRGAAEHMGRDNIKALNMIGQAKMGMVGKDRKRPGFAEGTTNVSTPGPILTPKPANPMPGNTGTWTPPPTPNQDLRAKIFPVKAARGASNVRKGMPKKGPGLTSMALQQAMASLGGGGGAMGQPSPMAAPMPRMRG